MMPVFKLSVLSTTIMSLLSVGNIAYAEDDITTIHSSPTLSPVVVTANRLPQLLSDTMANVSLITSSDIERSGAVDLPTLLHTQAGIEFSRYGSFGQPASVFIRGTSARNTLVLLDGIPLNNQNDGTPNLNIIPLDSIDRIEIVRGNVSAAYGSNATGGVIQLFTRQFKHTKQDKQSIKSTVNVGLGSQGSHSAYGTVGFKLPSNTTIHIGAGRTHTDGVSVQRIDQTSTVNPDKDASTQTTAHLNIEQVFSSTFKLGLKALSTEQTSQYDDAYAMLQTSDHVARSRLKQVGLKADWQVKPFWAIKVNVGKVTEKADYTQDNQLNSINDSQRQFNSIENTFELGRLGTALLGFEQEILQFSGEFFGPYGSVTPKQERKNKAMFAGWQGQYQALTLNANVRRDKTDSKNTSLSESVSTYLVGASYDMTSNWSVRFNQSTAFNRPTLGQMYGAYGNLNLKAERSNHQEVGVQWQNVLNNQSYLVRLTAFNDKTTHQFGFDPMTYQTINIDKAKNKGVELIGEMPLPWSGGRLHARFNSQKPINDTTGLLLNRRAKQQWSATVSGLCGVNSALSWNATASYLGNRNDMNYATYPAKAIQLKSFVRLDANIAYQFNQKTKVSASFANIGKANDQTAFGYIGTPRGVMVKLNHTF